MINKRGPHGLFLVAKRSLTPVIWMPLLSLTTLGILLMFSNRPASANQPQSEPSAQVIAQQPQTPAPAKPTIKAKPTPKLPAAPAASKPSPATQPATPTPPPYCTVASFSTPSAIASLSAAPGVTTITNPPVYYKFRGDTTASKTIAQATNCARQQPTLGGRYHGLTSYTISYAYDIVWIDGTTCRVDNVRVTLHQSILLPQADMTGMSRAAAAQWQASANKLQSHEYEHVAINRQHASILHDRLAKLTGACSSLDRQASATAKRIIGTMDADNNTFDNHTNHGRF